MIEITKSLIKKEDKILLIKRTPSSKFFPDLWDFPGGTTKEGEPSIKALIRETKEETSLDIIPGNKIADFNYIEHNTEIHFQIFEIKSFTGNITLSKDHTEFAWIKKENLKDYELAPVVKLFFKQN